jgi:hypothetical protein
MDIYKRYAHADVFPTLFVFPKHLSSGWRYYIKGICPNGPRFYSADYRKKVEMRMKVDV